MSLIDIFIKRDGENGTDQDIQTPVAAPVPPTVSAPTQTDVSSIEAETKTYVSKFREALRSQNTIGMKFIGILYKLSPNPGVEDYAKALSLLQIMDASASVEVISASLRDSKEMIINSKTTYLQQGNEKLTTLKSNRDREKETLQKEISDTQTTITNLERDLGQAKTKLESKQTELSKIDGRFQPDLDQTSATISAVTQASDETIASLDQVIKSLMNVKQ